ncbi:hypothetical protein [Vibrio cortegadensis]|uniref:hypothetical protein n=1 Tax=Vibrio cortegadensis TaxID=1328770 RepID=UPI00352DC4B3
MKNVVKLCLAILLSMTLFLTFGYTYVTKVNLLFDDQDKLYSHMNNDYQIMDNSIAQGFENFELDVMFINGELVLGHDESVLTGVSLEDFLSKYNDVIINLWLDTKNVSENNIVDIYNELENLNKKHNIKNRVFLEIQVVGNFVRSLTDHDWNVSYYFKNDLTVNPNDIFLSGIENISFEYSLLDSVEDLNLPSEILYNTWMMKSKIHKINFWYKTSSFYSMDKVSRIIIKNKK